MRDSFARLLPILIAVFLLTGCNSSARRSEPLAPAEVLPARVTCATCAAAQCPETPVDTGAQDTVPPEVVEDWLIQLAGAYYACRACAREHEDCLARHRARGDIR